MAFGDTIQIGVINPDEWLALDWSRIRAADRIRQEESLSGLVWWDGRGPKHTRFVQQSTEVIRATARKYREMLARVEAEPEYWVTCAMLEAWVGLEGAAQSAGLDTGRIQRVTGIELDWDGDASIRDLSLLAFEVGHCIRISVRPVGENGKWVPFTSEWLAKFRSMPPEEDR